MRFNIFLKFCFSKNIIICNNFSISDTTTGDGTEITTKSQIKCFGHVLKARNCYKNQTRETDKQEADNETTGTGKTIL